VSPISPPSFIGTISIENIPGYTQSTSVSLSLSASDICDVVEMRFSNDGIAWSPWVPYATSYTWDLVDPSYGGIDKDGIRYVFYPRAINTTYYAKVRAFDIVGNIGEYSPLSDGVDIVLQKSIIREYDANGNMTVVKEDVGGQVETLSILAYDAFDKLKTYTEDSLVTTMVYGGRRILYEVDGTGLEPSYVYGINLIARQEGISGSTAYYLCYGHGDVTGLVDVDGVLIGSFDYEAFGDILEETGINETPFKYAGEYLDRETELYLMGARYYASGMGRWITEDPLPKWLALGGTLDTIYPGGKVFIRIDQSNERSYLGAVFYDHEL
jgi:RHS repeat-associated protein